MRSFSLILALLVAPALTAFGQELKTVDGKTVKGKITAIDANDVTQRFEGVDTKTPLLQILAVDWQASRAVNGKYVDVRLIDDTVLLCDNVSFHAKDAELTLISGVKLRLPVNYVASMLRSAENDAVRRQYEKILKVRARRDRILVLRDGELNPLEGTLSDIDPAKQTIVFRREGGVELLLPLDRMPGAIFFRTEQPSEAAVCKVLDRDGSIISAAKIGLEEGKLSVRTTFGEKLILPMEVLAKLDFNLGRLTYLSDLLPAKTEANPWVGGAAGFLIVKDQSLEGGQIVLKERPHPKALSMFANSDVEYDLEGKYKDFKSLVVADPRTAELTHRKTTLIVYCDNRVEFKKEVDTKSPTLVQISVKDVAKLRFQVQGPNRLGYEGHLTLVDPRVSQ